jgi:tripartite-type tricarboxylate transporter receptor subunit TctC
MMLAALVAMFLGGLIGSEALAQTRKIVVPYPPGSGPDILSRLVAEQVGRTHGVTMVVENRPGGGTLIGTEAAARATPDGNTLLLVANSFVINPAVKRGTYDVVKNFAPVCYMASTPMVLVVLGTSPYRTLNDLVAAAREKPGAIVFSSGGPASSLHVAIEVLKLATKISVTYVPYAGTAPAINALMGGHVNAVWADYPTVVAQLQSGILRGLVTTSAKRVSTLPDVPTLKETGVSPYEADIFYGYVAPANTPADKIAELSGWFSAALKDPEMAAKIAKQGMFPVGMCGAPFGDFLRKNVADYARIIHDSGIGVK